MNRHRPIRSISRSEFALRLKDKTQEPDKRFALFIGAGC